MLVRLAGNGSLTVAPVRVLGPVLLTTMVYVSEVPGVTVPMLPFVLEPPRLSTFEIVNRLSLSVAVALGPGTPLTSGPVVVAVFESDVLAVFATVPSPCKVCAGGPRDRVARCARAGRVAVGGSARGTG